MANSTAAFGGFNALVDTILHNDNAIPKVDDIDTEDVDDNIDDNQDDDITDLKDDDTPEPPKKGKKQIEDDIDDDENDDASSSDDTANNDTTDLTEAEPEISTFFASSLAEKLGFELDPDKNKIESVDDVIGLMTEIVKANSKPEYANEEVASYDEYIRNGGTSIKDFYDKVYKDSIDINKIDLENEDHQKLVVETNLKNLGWKEDRVEKAVKRYMDAETLRDEAEDALDLVKEHQDKKSKKLLAEQQNQKIEAEKQNKLFYDNVIEYVNNLKDISGVGLNENDKKEIINYIFKVSPDGNTGFQKAYAANAVKNLVETAYFIHPKYRETLLSKTSKKATDDAMKKVREKLNASKGKRNTGSSPSLGKASPNFSSLSGLITK